MPFTAYEKLLQINDNYKARHPALHKTARLEKISTDLRKVSGSDRTWSPSYLTALIKGSYIPSAIIGMAIDLLWLRTFIGRRPPEDPKKYAIRATFPTKAIRATVLSNSTPSERGATLQQMYGDK